MSHDGSSVTWSKWRATPKRATVNVAATPLYPSTEGLTPSVAEVRLSAGPRTWSTRR